MRSPELGLWLEQITSSEFPQDVFRLAPQRVREDKEIVLATLRSHGFSLKFCSEEFRADRHVVRTALQHTGCALAHAAEHLRSDKAGGMSLR